MNDQTVTAPATDTEIRPFPVTHRMVVGIAVPMTLAYLTVPILGLVDTAVIGRLGDVALIGGLAVGSIIVDVIFTTFNFQRAGTTGLAAQAHGRDDEREKQAILYRALLLAAVIGVVTILVSPLLLQIGLWLMAPGEAVGAATSEYFLIRIWATPLTLANYAILGWLVGLDRTGLGLALQVLLNGVNIVLSVLLGLTLGYGIAGVAWATVIAELLAALGGLVVCLRLMRAESRPTRAHILDPAAIKRLFNLNADIMIRSFVLLSAFAYFTAQGAGFGELTLAANAILFNIVLTSAYFLDGMATAAEQIAGRAVGANHRASFLRGVRLTFLWNGCIAVLLTIMLLGGGGWFIDLITTNETVRAEARQFLLLAALVPLTGVAAFQLDGVYIGATWSRTMSVMMLLSFAIYVASFRLMPDSWGNTGLWIALNLFFIARGITLGLALPYKIRQTFDTPAHNTVS